MSLNLSGAIVVYNESKVLRRALESLKRVCNEIVLFDSYSTDCTLEIAQAYGCKVFQHEFDNHRDQKNRAIEKCTNEWVLLLDADEYLNNAMIDILPSLIDNGNGFDAWTIGRYNILDGTGPRDWPDIQTRLFKNYVRHGGHPFHHITDVNAKKRGVITYNFNEPVSPISCPFIYHDKDTPRQQRQNRLYYAMRPGDYKGTPPDGAEDVVVDTSKDPKRMDVNVYQEYLKKP